MKTPIIKSLVPTKCPNCDHDIVVAFTIPSPRLTSVVTPAKIIKAKTEVLKALGALNLPLDKHKELEDWVNDPDTLFTNDDVDEIIQNIQKDNDPATEDTA